MVWQVTRSAAVVGFGLLEADRAAIYGELRAGNMELCTE